MTLTPGLVVVESSRGLTHPFNLFKKRKAAIAQSLGHSTYGWNDRTFACPNLGDDVGEKDEIGLFREKILF